MEAKKDIGKAFREKLDSLDRQPGDALWDAISKDLDKKKKRRFPFFWFYSIGLIFIGLTVIAFVLYNPFDTAKNSLDIKQEKIQYKTSGKENTMPAAYEKPLDTLSGNERQSENNGITRSVPATEKNTPGKRNSSGTSSSVKTGLLQNNAETKNYTVTTKNGSNKKLSPRKNNLNSATLSKNKKTSKNHTSQSYSITGKKTVTPSGKNAQADDSRTADTTINNNRTATTAPVMFPQTTGSDEHAVSDNENIAATEKNTTAAINEGLTDTTKTAVDSLKVPVADKKEEKPENKKDSIPSSGVKKFSVFAFGGPSFFKFPGNTIANDPIPAAISTKTATRFGLLLGYRINEKLSIRAGISFYKLKQSAHGIKLSYTMGGSAVNPETIPPADFDWVDYNSGVSNSSIIDLLGNNNTAVVNLNLDLGYIEIPMEIGYTIYNKKFGLDAFAGGSLLLLNKNEVTATNDAGSLLLGKWNAAAKTSFAGTLGLGLYYNFSPSLQLNAEPVLNYYFNSYKDSKPYSFTLRFGLQYNFDF